MNLLSILHKLVRRTDVESVYSAALASGGKRKVAASDVAAYAKSPFFFYCNKFVDKSRRDDSRMLEALIARGMRHEQDASEAKTEGMEAVMVGAPTRKEAFRISLNHMAGGVGVLKQPPLFWLPEGMAGIPDMLVKTGGRSVFGRHHYSVVEIKSRKDVMPEHRVQAAFYSLMLGKIQRRVPETFAVINSGNEEVKFSVAEHEDAVWKAVAGVREVLGGFVPRATHGCPPPWTTYASEVARRRQDVTLVLGIGPRRQAELEGKNIRTIQDLLANPRSALSVRGVDRRQLEHAQSLLDGKPVRRQGTGAPARPPAEIFLDFEGVPGNSASVPTIYLIGMAVRTKSTEYIPFIAQSLEQEGQILENFVGYASGILPDCPIWHWGSYERTYLEGMGERHGVDCGPVLDRLADLHKLATGMFTFPVSSTGLKVLGGGVGFGRKRIDMDAFGAYLAWRRDPASVSVLEYNRDDCEAMISILDWLRAGGGSWRPAATGAAV